MREDRSHRLRNIHFWAPLYIGSWVVLFSSDVEAGTRAFAASVVLLGTVILVVWGYRKWRSSANRKQDQAALQNKYKTDLTALEFQLQETKQQLVKVQAQMESYAKTV